jgi:hypothetical protein
MRPLTETEDHKRAKDLFSDELKLLGYRINQEYDFVLVGFFGYQIRSIWRGLQDLKILRGSRYISKDKDIATYPHSIDIFAEKVTRHGIKMKFAVEIDGEIHREEEQKRKDRVFEMMWDYWVEDPKELFRVWKWHVLQMPPQFMPYFIQFVLKGKYRELLAEQKDGDIDILVLITKIIDEANRYKARTEQSN